MYRFLASMLLVIALASCGTQQSPQGALGVVSYAPGDDAVAVEPTVTVTFDRPVDASTLASRFTLSREGAAVEGSVRYVEGTRTASFTPASSPLVPGRYTATIESGVRGTDRSLLTATRSWSFDVERAAPGDPTTGDPEDPDDPTGAGTGLRAAFLSPTPNKRTAGLVNVQVDLEAGRGIQRAELFVDGEGGAGSVRVARWVADPGAEPVTRYTLSADVSTVDFETGAYTLRVRLEDRFGLVREEELDIEFLTPFLITRPTDDETPEAVGAGRQIVAITIGVNGTILDDYDVTMVDIYINGTLYAAGIPVDDAATSTRLIVYPWDTATPGLGGHPTNIPGDRVITARVYFVDTITETLRDEFTPGVLVNFSPVSDDLEDPDDPTDTFESPRAAFLSPTPNKRTAGLVNVEVDLEAEAGVRRAELFVVGESGSVRAARWDDDPDADPVTRDTLSATVSTVDFETGAYTLRVRLEDRAGNVFEETLGVEFLTPFLITNPIAADGVGIGNARRIVAITIGVNGTIMDDYDVTMVDIYINGTLYAASIPVDDDATSTRLIVYPWDTDDAGLGGHPTTQSGDRTITARVHFVDPVTGTLRNEFTPGVIVDFQP